MLLTSSVQLKSAAINVIRMETDATRKAAVVGKRTTAVYAEGGRNPLFKCV